MQPNLFIFAAVISGALLNPFALAAASPAERQTHVENGLRLRVHFEGEADQQFDVWKALQQSSTSALSVTVIKGGEIDWSSGYGVSERDTGARVTPNTLFQAASLSKPMTVIAAMRMRNVNLITFNEDISNYLTSIDLPSGAYTSDNPVTFQNLLSHTSGAMPRGYRGYANGADLPSDVQILRGEAPANVAALTFDTAPNTQLAYSGAGYTLVEQALQDAMGKPFDEIMDAWLIEPFGMSDSTFQQPLEPVSDRSVAVGYRADGTVIEGGWHTYPEQAAAGLWSTSNDIAQVLIEIYRASKGQSELITESDAHTIFEEQMGGHSFGFVLNGEGKGFSIRHFGGNEGYRGMFLLYPETGDGAVILSNSDAGFDVVIPMMRAIAAEYDWPDYGQINTIKVLLDNDFLSSLVGIYDFGEGIAVEVKYESDASVLQLIFPNGDIYDMVPTGERSFIYANSGVTIDFNEAGQLELYGDLGERVDQ